VKKAQCSAWGTSTLALKEGIRPEVDCTSVYPDSGSVNSIVGQNKHMTSDFLASKTPKEIQSMNLRSARKLTRSIYGMRLVKINCPEPLMRHQEMFLFEQVVMELLSGSLVSILADLLE